MALLIESIYLSKLVISIQIKVHEVYIKPLKPRQSLLTIKEEDEDDEESNENEEEQSEQQDIF